MSGERITPAPPSGIICLIAWAKFNYRCTCATDARQREGNHAFCIAKWRLSADFVVSKPADATQKLFWNEAVSPLFGMRATNTQLNPLRRAPHCARCLFASKRAPDGFGAEEQGSCPFASPSTDSDGSGATCCAPSRNPAAQTSRLSASTISARSRPTRICSASTACMAASPAR